MEPETKITKIYTRYFMLKYSKKKIQSDQIAKQTEKLTGNLFEQLKKGKLFNLETNGIV